MKLKIRKRDRLPAILEADALYLIADGSKFKAYLTTHDGSSHKVLEDTSLLPKHGETFVNHGEGIYTIDCRLRPGIMTLPAATGSQVIRVVSFTHVTGTNTGGLLAPQGQTIDGIMGTLTVTDARTVIVIDSEVNGYTTITSGADGATGPQGAVGIDGVVSHRGVSEFSAEGIYTVIGNGNSVSMLPPAIGSQNIMVVSFLANDIDFATVVPTLGDTINTKTTPQIVKRAELRFYVDAAVGAWTTTNKQLSYEYIQNQPNHTWVVNHGLDTHPTAVITDPSGVVINGAITYNSPTQCTIAFNVATSGLAILK